MFKRFLLLLVLLWGSIAHAGAIQELIDDGSLVGFWDFRSGHALDLSGQGNHGTITGTRANRDGRCVLGSDVITVADSPETQLIDGTLLVFGDFISQPASGLFPRVLSKRDAGGRNFELIFADTYIGFTDSAGTTRTEAYSYGGKCIAVSFENGGTPDAYFDGVLSGPMSGTVAMSEDDAPLLIGNNSVYNSPIGRTISAALEFNRVLTPTEHAAVYAELDAMRWPQKQSRGEAHYMGRELLVDGDMEASGVAAWTVGQGAVLTKRAEGAGQYMRITGNGVDANPNAAQAILTVGKRYRVIGTATGDGVHAPRILAFGIVWIGSASAAWQEVDAVFTATGASLLLNQSSADGYTQWDSMEVRELISEQRTEWDDRRDGTLEWGTDWGTPVTGNRTAGQFVGPFEIISGTHKVVTDTIEGVTVKAIECVVAGVIAIPVGQMRQTPSDAAYGTTEFLANKAAASKLSAFFVAATNAGGAGYSIDIEADESISVTETGVAEKFSTAAAAATVGAWHRIRITRSAAGEFTMYLDGVLMVAATGANPFTDTTTAVSNFLVFDLDAGDKIAFSDVTAGHAFNKFQGVVAP